MAKEGVCVVLQRFRLAGNSTLCGEANTNTRPTSSSSHSGRSCVGLTLQIWFGASQWTCYIGPMLSTRISWDQRGLHRNINHVRKGAIATNVHSRHLPPRVPTECGEFSNGALLAIVEDHHLVVTKVHTGASPAHVRQQRGRDVGQDGSRDVHKLGGAARVDRTGVREHVVHDDEHRVGRGGGAQVLQDRHAVFVRPVVEDLAKEKDRGRLCAWWLRLEEVVRLGRLDARSDDNS
jgi:hypothetical protein